MKELLINDELIIVSSVVILMVFMVMALLITWLSRDKAKKT